MLTSPVIELMLNRRSVRKRTDQKPTDEVIETAACASLANPAQSNLTPLGRTDVTLADCAAGEANNSPSKTG